MKNEEILVFQTDWDLRPLVGTNDVLLGMTVEEVVRVLGPLQDPVAPVWGSASKCGAWFRSSFAVHFAPTAEYIVLTRGEGLSPRLFGLDVFGIPAMDVVRSLERMGYTFDDADPELGHSFVFGEIQVAFWRGVIPESVDDEGGRYFDTVGIGVKGYHTLGGVELGSALGAVGRTAPGTSDRKTGW